MHGFNRRNKFLNNEKKFFIQEFYELNKARYFQVIFKQSVMYFTQKLISNML